MIEFTPAAIALTVAAFLIGLLFGRILWGGAVGQRDRLRAELAAERARAVAHGDAEAQHARDLAALRDQVKPLAEEVDRLRRENVRLATRTAPEAAANAIVSGPAINVDDLRNLKGVGDKFAARLHELGVSGIAELAALSPADAQGLDTQLGPFAGRIARDHLLDQARLLASGAVTEFEARYGRIERPVT